MDVYQGYHLTIQTVTLGMLTPSSLQYGAHAP